VDNSLYYHDYLQLDRLLACQQLESAGAGRPAHDEMLFIIVHQAYELWFKQILWEVDAVVQIMAADRVDEREVGRAVSHLERVTEIQRLLLQQIEVLETMTPLDFLDFRDLLVPASGFQSLQFRLIEVTLGIDPQHRMPISSHSYKAVLREDHRARLEQAEQQPSLLTHIERWLERTPFLHWGSFDFWETYRDAVTRMLTDEEAMIRTSAGLDEAARKEQLAAHEDTAATFATLFDRDRYRELQERGQRRISHEAFLAALLITLYRDEPMLTMPFRFLQALIAIDEGFTAWRQRHALMVHRMIGTKIGTGGTTGHRYLQATTERHRVFRDFFELSTFAIPRSALPSLPPEVRENLDFRLGSP
jgi:tryptophan 2,3-dioxygenase